MGQPDLQLGSRHGVGAGGADQTQAVGSQILVVDERHTLELLPERAAFCPQLGVLFASDLHLGKADTIAAAGSPLSDAVLAGILAADLARLTRAIARMHATRLTIVGDLLHAPAGLTPTLVESVRAWREVNPIPIGVVPGNHDRRLASLADAWKLDILAERHEEPPFVLLHHPAREPGRFVVAGHEHPAVVLRTAGDSVKLPAFHLSARGADRLLILPAFSRFTAGGSVRGFLGEQARLFAIAEGSVIEL